MTFWKQSIESNIWKLYGDRFFSCFWIIVPVLVPYYEASGLNATQVFIVQSVYSAFALVCEIPTGYLSDVIGRRKTLLLGALLLPAGVAVYAFSYGFWGFVLAELLIAVANSLRSGTDSALLYDTLIELKQEKKYKRFEGTGHLLERAGDSLAAVLGGLLGAISLRLPFLANILSASLLLPLAFLMKEPARTIQKRNKIKEHVTELLKAVKYCLLHPEIRYAIIYSALITGTGIVGIWSYYFYYSQLGIKLVYFGVLAATASLLSGVGGKLEHVIEKRIGRTAAFALPLLIAPSFILLGQEINIYAIGLVFLNLFLWGFSVPLLKNFINRRTPSAIRATVLSVTSMAIRVVYIVIAVSVGRLIDITSLQTAHIFLGVVFLVIGSMTVLSLSRCNLEK